MEVNIPLPVGVPLFAVVMALDAAMALAVALAVAVGMTVIDALKLNTDMACHAPTLAQDVTRAIALLLVCILVCCVHLALYCLLILMFV